MRRLIASLAVAAALALSASAAVAESQQPPQQGPPPGCAPAGPPSTQPGPPPGCGPGLPPQCGPPPPGSPPQPGAPTTSNVPPPGGPPGGPPPGGSPCPGGPAAPGAGFDRGFFNRVWKLTGQVLGSDTVGGRNVLELDVHKLLNPPKRFRDEGDEIADEGALVVVAAKVKITKNGKAVPFSAIDVDDEVRVHGKFLRADKWLEDEDGDPVPTVRAKRILVL